MSESQDDLALPEIKRRRTSATELFARINITQMTLLALTLIFIWQWLAGHMAISDMQQQLAKKIAEMDGNSKANTVLLTQSQEQVRSLSEKMVVLETRYAEAQNQRAALEALYNSLSSNRDEAILAEVEQSLLLADQQLQLSANVKGALIALQSADSRLQRTGQPLFNALRKTIGQDIERLRAVPDVDMTGMNFQLENLIQSVDELPLMDQQRTPSAQVKKEAAPANETAWEKLLREIWFEAKQLVRIQNTGKAELPLLPTNQEYFLRENIKLRLLAARLALMSRDEASFKQKLKTVQTWSAQYFDMQSPVGLRTMTSLNTLSASAINIELPDITNSLQAVRSFRLTRDKVTP